MSKKKRGTPRTGKTTKQRRREARSNGTRRTAETAAEFGGVPSVQPAPVFPIVSDHAGLTALSHAQRTERLGKIAQGSALLVLAAIQSRLDVAATTDWSEVRVERALLVEAGTEWANQLAAKVGVTHRLIPPRSMTQLIREALEACADADARDIEIADVLELVMSITSEHAGEQNPLDVLANPDPAEYRAQIAAIEAYTSEETVAAVRQHSLNDMANLLSNESVKIESIKASTYDLWFRPWPARVTDKRIGSNPAEAFELANKVPLLDVMVVGQIVCESIVAGQFEFDRLNLVRAGATEDAAEFVFKNMAYKPAEFARRLRRDRAQGPVTNQRYVFTERPFLRQDGDTIFALRYQWVVDRFFGAQLYWQTFFAFGPAEPRSTAEAFSLAMNDAFERVAGEILKRIASYSSKITRLVSESEMQAEWSGVKGRPPSVCDFMLVAGRACILIDATNHHLSAGLAQGLADISTYNEDMDSAFVASKFEQIISTAKLVKDHHSFGVEEDPVFIPYVVVPDNGLSNITSVQLDWLTRSASFEELRGSTRVACPP
ncbi:hypothetical protein [Gordonia sp. 852002-50395_SCH5434458]|uniref:hypothetical protein n=1 Tax=Gordonia sp. 852002-50395_SCH5434458 TaxID=1834090 RepID=UPI000A854488|nr:hypothetical protein [Gordonia sp. 852002-50395_SCH5434458]